MKGNYFCGWYFLMIQLLAYHPSISPTQNFASCIRERQQLLFLLLDCTFRNPFQFHLEKETSRTTLIRLSVFCLASVPFFIAIVLLRNTVMYYGDYE